jgi:hypothetical protein
MDTVQLSKVRILKRTHAKLEKEAAEDRTTLNSVIADHLNRAVEKTDELGGPASAARLRMMAAMADPGWTDDWELYFRTVDRWVHFLEATAPTRSPSDQEADNKEYQEIRQAVQEGPPEARRIGLLMARHLALKGETLPPSRRRDYAALVGNDAERVLDKPEQKAD